MLALRQMDDRVQVTREWFKDYRFHLVQDVGQLRKLVDMCVQRQLCSLDVETTGVDNRIYPDEYFEDGQRTRHGIRTIDRVVGLCISFDGTNGYYVPLSHEPEDSGNLPWDPVWDEITRLVEGARIIFHNKKFDAEFIMPMIGREYWKVGQFEDTMLMAKVVSPLKSFPAGLKQLARTLFGIDMVELDELFTDEKKEQLKRQKVRYNFALLHPREGLEYGCSDGIFTYKTYFALRDRIQGYEKIYDVEKAFCNVMREMERNRVHIDVERTQKLYVECQAAMQEVGDLIRGMIEAKTGKTGRWSTLNVGSPAQLSDAFFTDQEGLKLKPTPEMSSDGQGGFVADTDDMSDGGGDDDEDEDEGKPKTYSLKDEVLKSLHRHYGSRFSLQRPGVVDKDGKPRPESIFELILEYRHYDKMKGSYVEKLFKSHDRNGDVRPSFNQIGTDTTRLSCKANKIEDGYSGVNFQGIPRDSDDDKPELFKQIRTVIVPRPGWFLVKIDYAGEELRVATNMSGDPIWANSFLHGDGDVHAITGRLLYGKPDISKDERNRAKRCNFAIIYGGGAGAISRNVNCSIEDGGRYLENIRSGLPVLMGYVEHQKKFAHKHKCIYTAFGRRIPIPTIDSPIKAVQRKAERCAINYTIQATSADILKLAMCYVDKQLRALGWKDRVRYVLTVHDEVVFEIRPDCLMEIVRKLDEWMRLPWRLPKAHGKQWTVPLETEPGIDIHWRARFDYFMMVDGKKADPKDVAEDGTFRGKLKKGQYFADGRIYQEVPDFLKPYVWRLTPEESDAIKLAQDEGREWHCRRPDGLPPPAEGGPPALPEAPPKILKEILAHAPDEKEGVAAAAVAAAALEPVAAPATEPAGLAEGQQEMGGPAQVEERKSNGASALSDIDLDDLSADLGLSQDAPESEIGIGEIDIGSAAGPAQHEPEAQRRDPEPARAPVPDPVQDPVGTPVPVRPVLEGETVLRWTMTAVPSAYASRKLHAVCILAEGDVPLRVVSPRGTVLIPESDGVRVDPQAFRTLASLFGLG